MGIFDRMRDTPPEPPAPALRPTPSPTPMPVRAPSSDVPSRADAERAQFGVQKAIELMRALPDDHVELVVRVVKRTLEYANVDVRKIIDDAVARQKATQRQIDEGEREIAGLEAKIAEHRKVIDGLKAELSEAEKVEKRLQLACELDGKRAASSAEKDRKGPSASAQDATAN